MAAERSILERVVFALSVPDGLIALMMHYLNLNNLPYDNPKTLAEYSQDFKSAVVGAQIVNFVPSGFTYNDSEHFIVLQIAVYEGANATLAATDWEPGVADNLAKNGNLSFRVNGTQVLAPTPFTRFIPSTGNATVQGYYLPLAKPIFIQAQTTFELVGQFPTVVATANYNMNIQLTGIKLI